jgi:hypothetical protein
MGTDPNLKQQADALLLTVEDLENIRKNAADSKEAERRGIELWELRMRQRGESEESIEKKRAEWNQKIKKILQIE